VTVGEDEVPWSINVSRRIAPGDALIFSTPDEDHVHGFGELEGWAHFSLRIQAERIFRADCFVTNRATLDPEDAQRGRGAGIRFQPILLSGSPVSPENLIGAGAFARGLHYGGLITPGWYRLSVECDACRKDFQLQSFHAGMMDVDYMYSDSGLHTLIIDPGEGSGYPRIDGLTDEARRAFEARLPRAPDETAFRYYNALRCPHCRAPFFDYAKFPEDRRTDYYGHSRFGVAETVWTWTDPAGPAEPARSEPERPGQLDPERVFAARNNPRINYVGVGAVALLSLLGFILAGVIPTESTRNYGAYPLLGWSWIAVSALLIAILLRRARDPRSQLEISALGLWVRGTTPALIPWEEITGTSLYGLPRGGCVLRVALRNPAILQRTAVTSGFAALEGKVSGGDFGINPRLWDRSLDEIVEAIAFFRPGLAPIE